MHACTNTVSTEYGQTDRYKLACLQAYTHLLTSVAIVLLYTDWLITVIVLTTVAVSKTAKHLRLVNLLGLKH